MKLRDGQFISVVDSTPLVSIDLILVSASGEVLLGKRVNRPAQGYWFVPGGRIWKGERIRDAFTRICETELGVHLPFEHARLVGAFDHMYEDNFSGLETVTTHYVVLAYRLDLPDDRAVRRDDQHNAFQWWTIEALMRDPNVHPNTKNYFLTPDQRHPAAP